MKGEKIQKENPVKKRVPVAPPGQVHKDLRWLEKNRPTGRKAKHKRKIA